MGRCWRNIGPERFISCEKSVFLRNHYLVTLPQGTTQRTTQPTRPLLCDPLVGSKDQGSLLEQGLDLSERTLCKTKTLDFELNAILRRNFAITFLRRGNGVLHQVSFGYSKPLVSSPFLSFAIKSGDIKYSIF